VPQGSVGGPTYFSLFIDDMAADISSRMIQFADDTKLRKIIRNEDDSKNCKMTWRNWKNGYKWLLKFLSETMQGSSSGNQ